MFSIVHVIYNYYEYMSRYYINNVGDKISISRAVLGGLAVAGILSVAVLAPNAVQLFRCFKMPKERRKKIKNASLKYKVNATIARLEKEGCIIFEEDKGVVYASLTEKGRERLQSYESKNDFLKNRVWDGKWRIVIFDVEEAKRKARDKLRHSLRQFGFLCLQKSVWIFPYDCEDIISMLKTDHELWLNVLYIEAEKVEDSGRLQGYFKLKQTGNKNK